MRVLVGTDGSVGAQAAVRWALSMVDAEGGELIVATVRVLPLLEVLPGEIEARRGEDAELLHEWCAPARDSKVKFRELVLEGDPREQLLDTAKAEKVDLIVVGARGAGGHRHALHLGSTTHHLAHHTRLPLAAIPPAAKAAWPATVVVGVDGSPGSLRAIDWLASFGAALTDDVIAVTAQRPAEKVPRDHPSNWYQPALDNMQTWLKPLREVGLGARELVMTGDAVDVLTDAAIAEEAGLLVVGSRGVGGFTGLRLGTTALKVLHQGEIPVLMVPADVTD
jgi:nucleotide-binding universal stress UspA family protein